MKYKCSLLCSVLLLMYAMADGQRFFLEIGVGAGYAQVVDKEFSSIPYKGVGLSGTVTLRYGGERIVQGVIVSYLYGRPSTDVKQAGDASLSIINGAYSVEYRIGDKDDRLQVLAGAALDYLYAHRQYDGFINKNRTYEYIVSAGPALDVHYRAGTAWRLENRLMVPVAGATGVAVAGNNSTNRKFLSSTNGLLRVRNQLRLSRLLINGHACVLTYGWNYYRVRSVKEIVSAVHQLGIGYVF